MAKNIQQRGKIPDPDQEIPVNHPENLLFGFLGAFAALIVGLILYRAELLSTIDPGRVPASVSPTDTLENYPVP